MEDRPLIGAVTAGLGRKLRADALRSPRGIAWVEQDGWGFALRESAGLFELWAVPLSPDLARHPKRAIRQRDRVARGAGAPGHPRPFRRAYAWTWTATTKREERRDTRHEKQGERRAQRLDRPAPKEMHRPRQERRQARREQRPPERRGLFRRSADRGHSKRWEAAQRRRGQKVGSAPALEVWRTLRERGTAPQRVGEGGGLPVWYDAPAPPPASDPGTAAAQRADLAYSRAIAALDAAERNPQGALDQLVRSYRVLMQLQIEAFAAGYSLVGEAILYLAQRVGDAAVILGESMGAGAKALGEGVGAAFAAIMGGKPYDFWSDAWWFALVGLVIGGALLATGGGQQILMGAATVPAGVGYGLRSLGEVNVSIGRSFVAGAKPIGEGAGKLLGEADLLGLLGLK